MKSSKTSILIIIVFIATITLPTIIYWVMGKGTLTISTTENRTLSTKPSFMLATLSSYPEEYEDYYNDHLAFRDELISLWANLNYKIFNSTADSRAILGKDNWLFYRGDTTIPQVRGIARFTDSEKATILENLQENIDKLSEKEIETYVMVVPNKENIYEEYLPDNITIINETTKAEDLIDYIEANSDIDIIYPKEELLEMKEQYQIYKKYDTHWNDIGALVGVVALQKSIDPNFTYDMENLEVVETDEISNRDIAEYAGLGEAFSENEVEVTNFYSEIEYEYFDVFAWNEEKDTYSDITCGREYISNSQNDKTVVIIGDSFIGAMREYFCKLYSRVVFLNRDSYSEKFIEEINPDIVVIEVVERNSAVLSNKLFSKVVERNSAILANKLFSKTSEEDTKENSDEIESVGEVVESE